MPLHTSKKPQYWFAMREAQRYTLFFIGQRYMDKDEMNAPTE